MKTDKSLSASKILVGFAFVILLGGNLAVAGEKQSMEVSSDIIKVWRDPATGNWKSESIEQPKQSGKTAESKPTTPKLPAVTSQPSGKIG